MATMQEGLLRHEVQRERIVSEAQYEQWVHERGSILSSFQIGF
jgi:hypothetical protein